MRAGSRAESGARKPDPAASAAGSSLAWLAIDPPIITAGSFYSGRRFFVIQSLPINKPLGIRHMQMTCIAPHPTKFKMRENAAANFDPINGSSSTRRNSINLILNFLLIQ